MKAGCTFYTLLQNVELMRNCCLNNVGVHIRTPISAPVSVVIESIKEIPKGNQID
jgi:hypothetical protein